MTVRDTTIELYQLMLLIVNSVFIISVGSIPAKETVTTNLMFVMELDDDPNGKVRLQLPMSIGRRYGPEPTALATAVPASSETCLSITVDIQMSGVIKEVTSPTHPVTQLPPRSTSSGHPSHRRKTVKFESATLLVRDFVLTVLADGLDGPRCFAERDSQEPSTVAMQLTFIPSIEIAPISPHEYLFLVDRSGSMRGSRIAMVKLALTKILSMLPNQHTVFNIFSFGNQVDSLWPESRPRSSLSHAV
jgi:von Willebrand factor type A domain